MRPPARCFRLVPLRIFHSWDWPRRTQLINMNSGSDTMTYVRDTNRARRTNLRPLPSYVRLWSSLNNLIWPKKKQHRGTERGEDDAAAEEPEGLFKTRLPITMLDIWTSLSFNSIFFPVLLPSASNYHKARLKIFFSKIAECTLVVSLTGGRGTEAAHEAGGTH